MIETLPNRKHPRLKNYDYSSNGCYFVTINSYKNKPIFSKVIEIKDCPDDLQPSPQIQLTSVGETIKQNMEDLTLRYPSITVDNYVIMPTHIHAILTFNEVAEANPNPTLMDVICVLKSLITRQYNKNYGNTAPIWQTSFYDRVIQNEEGYLNALQYIDENPLKWKLDKYYNPMQAK